MNSFEHKLTAVSRNLSCTSTVRVISLQVARYTMSLVAFNLIVNAIMPHDVFEHEGTHYTYIMNSVVYFIMFCIIIIDKYVIY